MFNNVFKEIIDNLEGEEIENYEFIIFENDCFYFLKNIKEDKKSIKIKVKDSRKNKLIEIIKDILLKYSFKVEKENEFEDFYILKIEKTNRYIVLESVVDSHTQIPKCILKEFISDDGIKFDYISMKDLKIKKGFPKTFNTQYGYYSKAFENFLSDMVESKIGNVKSNLKSFLTEEVIETQLSLCQKDIQDIFQIQVFRNPEFVKEINEKSITSSLIGGYTTEKILAICKQGKFKNIFSNKYVSIIVNKTKEGLITNKSTISEIKIDNNNEILIMPINPKIALVLLEKDYYLKKTNGESRLYYMKVDNIQQIRELNKWIYAYAKRNLDEAIIGKKDDLIELSKSYPEIIV